MTNWIIPCNIKLFDIVAHFIDNTEVVWKQDGRIRKGDTIYIYVGLPLSQIKYKCHVVDIDISREELLNNKYALVGNRLNDLIKYMKLKLDFTYKEGALRLNDLKSNGLSTVQKQVKIYEPLLALINREEVMGEDL